MKNLKSLLWSMLAFGLLTTMSCSEQGPIVNIPPAVQFSITTVVTDLTGMATDAELAGKLKIKNETTEQLSLTWLRENVDLPRGWETAICDHNLCYATSIGERPFVLEANQEIEMKFNFYPNDVVGVGKSDLSLFVTADKEGTKQTTNFSVTAN